MLLPEGTVIADEIGIREFYQTAETIAELMDATGQPYKFIAALAKERVLPGEWEVVRKRTNPGVAKAYRTRRTSH